MAKKDLTDRATLWLWGDGPKPQVPEEELFDALMESEYVRAIERHKISAILTRAKMSKDQQKRFKKFFLQRGIEEGWLEAEVFGT